MDQEIDDILSKVDNTSFGECHANHTLCMLVHAELKLVTLFIKLIQNASSG
jgi:hypothetical protein